MPVLSKGCRQCYKGAKLVLFVTGKCHRRCWYCPISDERKDKDVVFANDRQVFCDEDLLKEAHLMSALGTGVTGGEPFMVSERVAHYCTILKKEFGQEHHIHLYTGIAPGEELLRRYQGLIDEIRLHPPQETWENILESPYIASADTARRLGFECTIEVPSLPGLEKLIPALPHLDHLNINELEWSATNAEAMRDRDLDLEDNYHNAVLGAERWATEILTHEKVHWCSSAFKDSVQLRERLKRIAGNTARPFDEITDDGTIVYGVLEPEGPLPDLEPESYEDKGDHIEMAWWILLDEALNLPGKKYVIERYPNEGMIVELTPL